MVAPASADQSGRIVQCVALLRLHHLGDRLFDYSVPAELAERVSVGSVVTVPFGRRTARAVVVGIGPSPGAERSGLREIAAVSGDRVSADLLGLARALSVRYLCSLESCLRLVAPPGRAGVKEPGSRVRRDWVARGSPAADTIRLTAKQRAVLEAVPRQGISAASLQTEAGVGRGVLLTLERKGLLTVGAADTVGVPSEPWGRGSLGRVSPE
jgi:primosomal protein N'